MKIKKLPASKFTLISYLQYIRLLLDARSSNYRIINMNDHGGTAEIFMPGRIAQLVARLIQEPEVLGSIPGPATYFRFSFH